MADEFVMLHHRIATVGRRLGRRLLRMSFPDPSHQSETSKCRSRLSPFCAGYGVDIGPGGDPISPHAVRVDLEAPYSGVGSLPVQLGGDATNLKWFRDGVLDFVYSSHVLEDFVDPKRVLVEWLRVLKPGGSLVLYCPNEIIYRKHCDKTGQAYNPAHKLKEFSFQYVLGILVSIDPFGTVRHSLPNAEIYSWDLVWAKGDRHEVSTDEPDANLPLGRP